MSVLTGTGDATQPVTAMSPGTEPLQLPRRPTRGGGRCLLLCVIFLTSLSLLFTLALLLATLAETGLARFGWRVEVAIVADGRSWRARSDADSVAQLLRDEGVIVPAGAALSHGLDEPLTEGMVVTITPAREVRLNVAGDEQTLYTSLGSPQDILAHAGVAVGEDDIIRINGAAANPAALARWTAPANSIDIRRAFSLTIIDGQERQTARSGAETVGEALRELGIALDKRDEVEPALETAIDADTVVTIRRATPIRLEVDGVVIDARVAARTVAEALSELDASLFEADYVVPDGATPVTADMLIEIVRVTEQVIVDEERIPFETRWVADAELPLDERRTAQTGQAGIRQERIVLRYENGVEVSRRLETVETQPARDQVIHYGAQVLRRAVNTPSGTRHYWRVMCMLATSYHPGALGGDDTTAIGWKLAKGVVAADPALIPYRVKVFVPGYGVATMADTGGPRSSPYWIDLGYSDADYRPWRKYVKVYLLMPAPAEIDYLLPRWTPNQSFAGSCD